MSVIEDYETLEDVVRDSYGSVVWSHKIQEKQSDIYAERYKKMEVINIAAASLTSVGIVAMIFTDPLWLKLVSAVISFATVFITAYYKSFDLQKMTSAHKGTANKLIGVRDQYKILLLKINMKQAPVETLIDEYEKLVSKTDEIYSDAPSTSDKAVERASEALKVKKDNSFSEGEIDSFLPESLRRSGR